jgi:hypothetical protein
MTPVDQLSFHEATITGIARRGNVVTLTLDDALLTGSRGPAEVTIAGVRNIQRDGLPVAALSMEEKDGEILTLREQDGGVRLVVEWNDFATRRQHIVVYDLIGGTIAVASAPT